MTRRAWAEQLVGECILYAPIIGLAVAMKLTAPILTAMVTFFVCKWAYQVKAYYHHDKGYMCGVLSYGVFLCIGLISAGLGSVSPFLAHQPMIAILLSVAATWAYAIAGDVQHERAQPPAPPFQCATATPEEIRERGIRKGLKDEDIEFLIKAHRMRGYRKALAAELGIEENSVKERKRRLTAVMEK